MLATAALLLALAAPRLVVVPFEARGASDELAAFGTERVAQALVERGLEVVTAQDARLLLGAERQARLEACLAAADAPCVGELARALQVGAVVRGVLSRGEGRFRAEVTVLDATTLQPRATASSDTGEEWRTLPTLDAVADALALQLDPSRPASPGPGARLWLPVGVAAALVAGGGVALGLGVAQVEDLQRPPRAGEAPLDFFVARQQFRDSTMLRTTGITLMGLGAATAALAVVLAVTAPVAVVPLVGGGQVGAGVAGAF